MCFRYLIDLLNSILELPTVNTGTRTSPITLVDRRTADAQLIVNTLYRTKVQSCPPKWADGSVRFETVKQIGVTGGELHTILEKNELAVFDGTKETGKTSDDLFVIHRSSQKKPHPLQKSTQTERLSTNRCTPTKPHKVSPTSFSVYKYDSFETGNSSGKVVLMVADMSVNNFTLSPFMIGIGDKRQPKIMTNI
ncbi:hypothetical protein GCK72_012253 [Caenorhabditis remanei]|uniref:Uncharacterized protein n=1 Tax=Caenorhabditis remanei TaxID=31234 RepID=A0A6A5GMF7_CAERE|nr:hypothetical protein GCK72_012253 [Caenorhabditis remanei]KAF1755803.1 hypothetical protein GCK72_012253 [Caenorhabditis remanei]